MIKITCVNSILYFFFHLLWLILFLDANQHLQKNVHLLILLQMKLYYCICINSMNNPCKSSDLEEINHMSNKSEFVQPKSLVCILIIIVVKGKIFFLITCLYA